jgi:hypothetical protein
MFESGPIHWLPDTNLRKIYGVYPVAIRDQQRTVSDSWLRSQNQKETAPPSTAWHKELKHENHNHVVNDSYSLYQFKTELSEIDKSWSKINFSKLYWIESMIYSYFIEQCSATFLFTHAHPILKMVCEGTAQNFALHKGGTKQYMDTNNADSMRKS